MQKLQLAIPEPCHENWQQMTPTEQGRFCNACAKEVIDFSMMTDTEVLNYFTKVTNEKVCGRALPSQLERTISKPKDLKKRLFWYWNYMVMFFMFFGKGNAAKAQEGFKPVTEMNRVKPNDVRGEIAAVSEVKQNGIRVISGKVADKDGNPVSFASIKIEGTTTGFSADANGAYSLRVKSNAILIISGAGFKDAVVRVGTQTEMNTVLENSDIAIKEVVVTIAGGIKRRPVHKIMTESKDTTRIIKSTVIFEVKDDNTGLAIENAVITITTQKENLSDKILSDNKGNYNFTEIKLKDRYFVKVEAAGYESNEFTIDAKDFEDRKKPWEVLLKTKKSPLLNSRYRAAQNNKGDFKDVINVVGQTRLAPVNNDSLYVIDGSIATKAKADNLNPDDISDIIRLDKSAAAAIFGIEGSNGAILITTRKAKEISLNEVVVNSGELITCSRTAGGISYTNIYEDSFLGDTIATVKTILTESIKVYPNPIQRGYDFSVALKLKQPGKNYSLLITDASGKILLQRKFTTSAKDHTEKISGDKGWAAGVYYLRIFDTQNKLVSKSSFVFQ